MMQAPWITNLTLFNQQSNGNGQRSPALGGGQDLLAPRTTHIVEFHLHYLTAFHNPVRQVASGLLLPLSEEETSTRGDQNGF